MSTMDLFDSSMYYQLSLGVLPPDRVLSCRNYTPPAMVYMSRVERNYTSTNWQFFYQKGIYFIRNHDHNLTYHLGLESAETPIPTMLRASTAVGQQWTIETWPDDNTTYKLVNRLNRGVFMGVGEDTSNNRFDVNMWTTEEGSRWSIQQNPAMGSVTGDMLRPYGVIEQGPTTTGGAYPTATSERPNNFFHPGEWKPLDKAGVVIGILVFIFFAVLVYLWWRRSKKRAKSGWPPRGPATSRSGPQHGDAEELPEPPPAYNARPNATFANQAPTTNEGFGGYYNPSPKRTKAADERSIELPPYGSPSVEGRSFV